MTRILRLLIAGSLALLVCGQAAWAAGGGTAKPGKSQAYLDGAAMVAAENYAEAIAPLTKALESDPKDADAHNLLGYSHRRLGDRERALSHYKAALELDPKHRGANEYLGELYLEMGELAKAEERLSTLDSACFFGCEEYSELKEAIAAYKAKNGN